MVQSEALQIVVIIIVISAYPSVILQSLNRGLVPEGPGGGVVGRQSEDG